MFANEYRHAERQYGAVDANVRETETPPAGDGRDHSVLAREFILTTVTTVFDVEADLILLRTRGKASTARARQVAMYLAHVACELSLPAGGRMCARAPTTVAHACSRVEDARERPKFDRAIGMMERSVRAIVRTSAALRQDLERAEAGADQPMTAKGDAP